MIGKDRGQYGLLIFKVKISMFTRNKAAILMSLVFVAGAGWIVYNGRPVMDLKNDTGAQAKLASQSAAMADTQPNGNGDPASFTMDQVAAHNTENDCWSAINNEVYDLSSWVSRHPGGPETIIRLCGSDGSGAFNRRHGRSASAQAALVLLKIGQLK